MYVTYPKLALTNYTLILNNSLTNCLQDSNTKELITYDDVLEKFWWVGWMDGWRVDCTHALLLIYLGWDSGKLFSVFERGLTNQKPVFCEISEKKLTKLSQKCRLLIVQSRFIKSICIQAMNLKMMLVFLKNIYVLVRKI